MRGAKVLPVLRLHFWTCSRIAFLFELGYQVAKLQADESLKQNQA